MSESTKDILLIGEERFAEPVAAELRRTLDRTVEVVDSRRAALGRMRRQEFALVVLEEGVAVADASGAELLYTAAGAAPVLEMSFATHGAMRAVRQVRAALHRREQDAVRALTAATQVLRGELNASLTGLLLQSQLALRSAAPADVPKMMQLVELADDLRRRLQSAA